MALRSKESHRIVLSTYNKYRKLINKKHTNINKIIKYHQGLKNEDGTNKYENVTEQKIINAIANNFKKENPKIYDNIIEKVKSRKNQWKTAQKKHKIKKIHMQKDFTTHIKLTEQNEDKDNDNDIIKQQTKLEKNEDQDIIKTIDENKQKNKFLALFRVGLGYDEKKNTVKRWISFKQEVLETEGEFLYFDDARLKERINYLIYQLRESKEGNYKEQDFLSQFINFSKIGDDFTNIGDVEPTKYNFTVDCFNIEPLKDKELDKQKCKGVNFKYMGIDENRYNNDCVLHFLDDSFKENEGFKKYTFNTIKRQFKENLHVDTEKGISLSQFDQYIKQFHDNYISYYAFDPLYNIHKYHIAKYCKLSLAFIVQNHHLYPISDKELKEHIQKTKELDISRIKYKKNINQDSTYFYIDKDNKEEVDNLIEGEYKNYDVVYTNFKLRDLIHQIIGRFNIIPICNILKATIKSFIHPISQKLIEFNDNFEMNKKFCDDCFKLYPCHNFKFQGQTISQITQNLYNIVIGPNDEFQTANEDFKIIDDYNTTPLIQKLINDDDDYKFDELTNINLDRRTAYPNTILMHSDDIPIFGLFDNFQKFNENDEILLGEYLIKSFKLPNGLIFKEQIFSYACINEMLTKKYITKKDILLKRYTKKSINAAFLQEFVNFCFKNFDQDIAKNAIRMLIGQFGKRYTSREYGAITNDQDSIFALYLKYYNQNAELIHSQLETVYDFYDGEKNNDALQFFRITYKDPLYINSSSIWRHIVGFAELDLIEMIDHFSNEFTKVISVNTDCVNLENPEWEKITKEMYDKTDKFYKVEKWHIRGNKLNIEYNTDEKFELVQHTEWNMLPDPDINDDKYINELKDKSFICCGSPGCLKSTLLSKIVDEETLILTLPNKASDVVRKMVNNPNIKICTFDSYFKFRKQIEKKYKRVCADEFSMIGMEFIQLLYTSKIQNPSLIIQLYGDPNQCNSCDKIYEEYMKKDIIKYMCGGNLLEKKYNPNCARYSQDVRDVLEYLLKNRKLPECLNDKKYKIDENIIFNICRTNNKVDEINNKFKHLPLKRVICNKNFYKFGAYNSRIYNIHTIVKDKYQLLDDNNEVFKFNGNIINFDQDDFNPVYSTTVYRCQSETLKENINIREVNLMNFNEIYTAISRIKSLDQLHLEYSNKTFNCKNEHYNYIYPSKCRFGNIYLLNNDEHHKFYVGRTYQDPKQRLSQHLDNDQKHNTLVHKYSGEWKQTILDNIYTNNIMEIEKLETFYIQKYKSMYGDDLINKRKVKNQHKKAYIVMGNMDNKIKEEDYKTKNEKGIIPLKYINEYYQKKYFIFRITRFGKQHTKYMRFNNKNYSDIKKQIQEYAINYINNL
ncbi:MAG: hypothetical protein WC554_02035 [Clostridia bacterium]